MRRNFGVRRGNVRCTSVLNLKSHVKDPKVPGWGVFEAFIGSLASR